MAALAPGLQLAGRYTLERRLGSGGMAEVWSAFDAELRQRVAIKALDARLAAQAGMLDLLRNEHRNVRRLEHPHIVRALDFRADGERPFIVFELVEGGDMRRLVGTPPVEFLPRLLPVVDALAHAHAAGIVHRDLKLENILVDALGGAHVSDFGIAATQERDGLALRTGGTPAAMSPQQLAREPASPADDLYALGVMLHELTFGAPPFPVDAPPERMRDAPVVLPERAGVPPELTRLIGELMAANPAERPAGMEEVATRLRQILAAAVTTVPPDVTELAGIAGARFEQVEPLSPRRGRAHDRPELQRPSARFRLRYAVGATLFLLVAAVVFAYLPRTLPKVDVPPVVAAPPAAAPAPLEIPGPAPFELAKLARARAEARALVDRIVELQAQAEDVGVLEWAADEDAAATARAQAGDAMFKAQDYDGARAAYQEAAAALEALVGRAGDVLADNVAAGWAAYAAHDAAAAIAHFQLALKIDPAHADAARGLRRAERLDQVSALMASGAAHERDGQSAQALAAYREANALDPDLTEARERIQRISAQLGRAQFDAAMSEGFAALERGDAAAARNAFTRARSLDPGSNSAADALAQVEGRVRTGQFQAQREQAAAEEAAERWAAAAAIYDQVLQADSTLVFAQEGAARARQMAKAHEQLDAQLAAPERLSADAVYESAQALLAATAKLPGAELARKRGALEQILAVARTPVHVRFESDDATEVVLHQVSQLGRFTVRELDLRPGTYTAVGTRPGYRDVRRKFTVVAGQPGASVDIRCEERI